MALVARRCHPRQLRHSEVCGSVIGVEINNFPGEKIFVSISMPGQLSTIRHPAPAVGTKQISPLSPCECLHEILWGRSWEHLEELGKSPGRILLPGVGPEPRAEGIEWCWASFPCLCPFSVGSNKERASGAPARGAPFSPATNNFLLKSLYLLLILPGLLRQEESGWVINFLYPLQNQQLNHPTLHPPGRRRRGDGRVVTSVPRPKALTPKWGARAPGFELSKPCSVFGFPMWGFHPLFLLFPLTVASPRWRPTATCFTPKSYSQLPRAGSFSQMLSCGADSISPNPS